MGGINPNIALQGQLPNVEGPMQQYQQALTLKSIIGQQALQQQQGQINAINIQKEQQAAADQTAMTTAMRNWDGKDPHDLVKGVLDAGGSASAVNTTTTHILDMREKASKMAEQDATTNSKNLETQTKQFDSYRGRLQSIIGLPADQQQQRWDDEITKEEQAGAIRPGTVSHQYPGDDQASLFANHYALGSVLAKEATEKQAANARQQQAAASTSQAQTSATRLGLETPGLQAKAAGAATDEQLAQTEKSVTIAKNIAETAKAKQETLNIGDKPIYAFNQKSGQVEQTTRSNMSSNPGVYSNPVDVKEADIRKDTELARQLGDAQLNLSRYRASSNQLGENLSAYDRGAIADLLSDDKFKVGFMGSTLPTDWLSKLQSSAAWKDMSPQAQAAAIGYIGARGSVIAYQKAVSGSGRANKEQLELELQNIPTPLLPKSVRDAQFERFQQNIEQTGAGLPKMVGIERPKEIRQRIEAEESKQQPAAQGAGSGPGSSQAVPAGATPVKNIFGKVIGYDQNGKRVLFSAAPPRTLQNLLAPIGETPTSGGR